MTPIIEQVARERCKRLGIHPDMKFHNSNITLWKDQAHKITNDLQALIDCDWPDEMKDKGYEIVRDYNNVLNTDIEMVMKAMLKQMIEVSDDM